MRSWAGMLVRTPGNLPILGEVPGTPGFFVSVVTSGFSVGAATGEIMGELLAGREPGLDIAPYSPALAKERAQQEAAEQDH
jgi:sarcosine oxidase subunit beta